MFQPSVAFLPILFVPVFDIYMPQHSDIIPSPQPYPLPTRVLSCSLLPCPVYVVIHSSLFSLAPISLIFQLNPAFFLCHCISIPPSVLPPASLSTFLLRVVIPRLRSALEQWDPRQDTVPVHVWLHPWLPILSDSMAPLHDMVRYKLGGALQVRRRGYVCWDCFACIMQFWMWYRGTGRSATGDFHAH